MTCLKRGLWLSDKLSADIGAVLTVGVAIWMVSAVPSYAACEFFSTPQRYNTQVSAAVIVIGRQSRRPYQVVVPSADPSTLAEIRACVLDAFATRSRVGSYVQVGSFRDRSDAEVVSRLLRQSGYPARVTYRR